MQYKMRLLVTGGAGFIGSHFAETHAKKGDEVIVFDNLSRTKLLNKSTIAQDYNWNYLKQFPNIKLVQGDVRNFNELKREMMDVDVILHAAAQTAVTTSIVDPYEDFTSNALGTVNVIEAARQNDVNTVLYCSTNKVYGNNVNLISVEELPKRHRFHEKFDSGIHEDFSIDLCEHTPYGCSKLTGDLYMQDYGHLYGLKTGVFRMSCIYGNRQLGVEDQGWVAWFAIATELGLPLTIYGDGKQVRDVLFISDLIQLYDKFIESAHKHLTLNLGGGPNFTLSLHELVEVIEKLTGKRSEIKYGPWRPSDQKVYISNISKAKSKLDWEPTIKPEAGVEKVVQWVQAHRPLFEQELAKKKV